MGVSRVPGTHRARQPEIQGYYDDILLRRFIGSGRVTFLGASEYHTDGSSHLVTSRVSGETMEVDVRRRVVDATYPSPTIPATTPPPFGIADDARVVAINELASWPPRLYHRFRRPPRRSVLLANAAANRSSGYARVTPDLSRRRPAQSFSSTRACCGHHGRGRRRRVTRRSLPAPRSCRRDASDRPGRHSHDGQDSHTRHMGARPAPHYRTRRSHGTCQARDTARDRPRRRVGLTGAGLARGALRGPGLQYPPLVPVWEPDKIQLQTIRVGFPCFCAALAGYVEATRDDDRDRNRLCPPNTLPNNPTDWARMQVRGTVAARKYGAEPDIAAWANGCALNPARVEPSQRNNPAVQTAAARLADDAERGLARMAELAHEPLDSATEHRGAERT